MEDQSFIDLTEESFIDLTDESFNEDDMPILTEEDPEFRKLAADQSFNEDDMPILTKEDSGFKKLAADQSFDEDVIPILMEEDPEFKKLAADQSFNPNILIPVLKEVDPDFKEFAEEARYYYDGLIVHMLANLMQKPVGVLSRLCVRLKESTHELQETKKKLENAMKLLEKRRIDVRVQRNYVSVLQSRADDLSEELRLKTEENGKALNNMKTIIHFVTKSFCEKIEEKLRTDFSAILKEGDETLLKQQQKLLMLKMHLRNKEEEKRRLEKELEENKRTKKTLEDVLNFRKATINEYKMRHYCVVCERAAAFVCCIHTSYCSSNCQAMHAEEHQKICKKTKPSIIQQAVSQQESSDSCPVASFTRQKKAKIQGVPAKTIRRSPRNHRPGPSLTKI